MEKALSCYKKALSENTRRVYRRGWEDFASSAMSAVFRLRRPQSRPSCFSLPSSLPSGPAG